jgi:unsaturated rhamnogalacturonyl hydrolase
MEVIMNKAERYIEYSMEHFKNYKEDWNYEDGCVLMGCVQLFQATGDKRYQEFVLNYLEGFIREDGTIVNYEEDKFNIDSINPGKVLFSAYEWTGETKYLEAVERLMNQVRQQPRTGCGNFWHKKIYPNQIWLDGLYMAQPFYMAYETRLGKKENYNDIINQFKNVRKYLYNENKGLYYHAYDEAREQFWADKATGTSPNFWLRSMGWYLMALVDVMSEMDETIFEQYKVLEELLREAVKGILTYQDEESSLFYQVIDRSDKKENYLETSGSAMIGYAILKGCRLGALLKEKYQSIGEAIVASITERMIMEEKGAWTLNGICSVAGLGPADNLRRDGSVDYYLSEPIVSNDHKGMGAYFMAVAEKLLIDKKGHE